MWYNLKTLATKKKLISSGKKYWKGIIKMLLSLTVRLLLFFLNVVVFHNEYMLLYLFFKQFLHFYSTKQIFSEKKAPSSMLSPIYLVPFFRGHQSYQLLDTPPHNIFYIIQVVAYHIQCSIACFFHLTIHFSNFSASGQTAVTHLLIDDAQYSIIWMYQNLYQ